MTGPIRYHCRVYSGDMYISTDEGSMKHPLTTYQSGMTNLSGDGTSKRHAHHHADGERSRRK